MHRPVIQTRSTVAGAALIAFLAALGLACSPETEEEPIEPDLVKISSVIDEIRQKIRSAEGREGILAEERLYSLFDEEVIIRDFFQDRRDGFFLDVGCAWPVRANNTYYLEKHLGWKGIGIDALADYGADWKTKRPGSRFFSYLVTDHSGVEQTFFKSPNLGLSSTRREMAAGSVFGDELEPEAVQVETITLNDLLDREGVAKIDLLSLDIEGHEATALAGFDIERFQPGLVVVERPIAPEGVEEGGIYLYFRQHGYELIERYRPFDLVNHYFQRSTGAQTATGDDR